MKKVPLTQGQVAIVDDEDFERVQDCGKWYAAWDPKTRSFRAQRVIWDAGNRRYATLHMPRIILGLEPGDGSVVDHINHDTLDNRRSNLSIGTLRDNAANRRDQAEHGAGIQQMPTGRFRARAWVCGREQHIGVFDTAEEAREARRIFLERP